MSGICPPLDVPYPYAGHVRFMLYVGPIVCLLAGLGIAVLLDRLAHPRTPRHIPVVVLAMSLLLIPVGSMARDFLQPFKQLDYHRTGDVSYTDRVELYEFVPKSVDTLSISAERNPYRRAHALEVNRRVR